VSGFQTPSIDWAALTPELVLLGGASLVLVLTLFLPARARRPFAAVVAGACFVAAGIAAGVLFSMDESGRGIVADALRRDRLAELAQILIAGSGFLAVLVSYEEPGLNPHHPPPNGVTTDRLGEWYALLLSAAAGMAFFVAADNLITLFLGLEWFSISLYILCAISVERLPALEAGLKYLIVGSFSSAILLFGSAFVYGATGEIGFEEIARGAGEADRLFFVAGLAMILVGLAFKASAAPFHMWTPDVYQGAPTPVTAFMSAATKVAALVLTLRLLDVAFPQDDRLWTIALAVIVCMSLAWGNLAALVQTDVKRLLAYSSISHAGFLLMPVAIGTELGGRALLYYLMSYGAMSIGAFAVVAARERELGRPVGFAELGGLGWERPFLGLAMAVFMFGFIGLPPAGLFLGKFYVFSAAVDRGWAWLAIVGVVATVVSIYYYLGVVRAMYMQPGEMRVVPAGGSPPRDVALHTGVGLALLVTVGTFLAADPLIDIARDAVDFLAFPH
jgi:NADH-quinone oxidoreductase subunit N